MSEPSISLQEYLVYRECASKEKTLFLAQNLGISSPEAAYIADRISSARPGQPSTRCSLDMLHALGIVPQPQIFAPVIEQLVAQLRKKKIPGFKTCILLCRQNPKIFRIDDTEIIGDGIPV